VLDSAAGLEDADRTSFLNNVEDNVRILALAGEWLGEDRAVPSAAKALDPSD
jgi:hypothetical protein